MNRVWRAPLAATLLGALLVFGFNMFSCIILIKKSINRSGPGFGYGFLVAFCFTLSFFCLLVGLIMDSFRDVVKTSLQGSETPLRSPRAAIVCLPVRMHVPASPRVPSLTRCAETSWTKYSTEMYQGAEVFAFICFVMFMLFFLTLVIFQSAVTDHLGMSEPAIVQRSVGVVPVCLSPRAPARQSPCLLARRPSCLVCGPHPCPPPRTPRPPRACLQPQPPSPAPATAFPAHAPLVPRARPPTASTDYGNPYVPMADPASTVGLTANAASDGVGVTGLGTAVGASASDGKDMGDAAYAGQYNPNDYMASSDAYGGYYSQPQGGAAAGGYQQPGGYQQTTEYNPQDYSYEQQVDWGGAEMEVGEQGVRGERGRRELLVPGLRL
jgi:hypothetical protein